MTRDDAQKLIRGAPVMIRGTFKYLEGGAGAIIEISGFQPSLRVPRYIACPVSEVVLPPTPEAEVKP